ncbi:MAG: DUF1127 domain-containing protein [Kiloniellales bacterium]
MGPQSQHGQTIKTLVRLDPRPRESFIGFIRRLPQALLERLLLWQQRASERTHLDRLSERDLKDVGLTREQIARESGKPFWRA